jgi:hypothetical protein
MQLDTPNLTIPLVPSYNERGVNGYTATVTNSLDQRRINTLYEMAHNTVTGKLTPYIVKRPGLTDYGVTVGAASDVQYLNIALLGNGVSWTASLNGTTTKVWDGSTNTSVVTAASLYPQFIDKTVISGVETVVLSLMDTSGSFDQRTFYASAIGAWSEITDGDYTGNRLVGKPEHMDGFMFQLTGANRIVNSDLNSLANWTATNYETKLIRQDEPAGLAKCGSIILTFGNETVEAWYNAGNATASPLKNIPQLAEGLGLGVSTPSAFTSGSRHYYATLGRRIFFVGRRAAGALGAIPTGVSVFSFDGSRFEKVSTPAVDKILQGRRVDHISTVSVSGQTAVAFSLGIPASTTQRALMFFPEWNDWAEWTSIYAQFANDGTRFLGIDTSRKQSYFAATDTWQDNAVDFDSIIQFEIPNEKGSALKFMRMCGLDGTIERNASTISIEFSDDDGVTWQTARTIDRTALKQNLYRCGSYRRRFVRITNASNFQGRLKNFLARID